MWNWELTKKGEAAQNVKRPTPTFRGFPMARSMAFEDLATVVHVWVDDWYQAHAAGWRQGQAGAKPRFRDSEVITLLLLMDFLPFPGETQFPGFVRAHYRSLFPHLLSQSQFNRRARRLWPWAEALGATRASLYLLDTKPLPVVGYKRDKGRRDCAATADYGVCASRNLKYFGYKLVLLCTPAGVPAAYELVPASTDERVAGEQVLDWVWQACILGDKGFIGADWQQGYRGTRGLDILTPARTNQRTARSAGFQQWLHRLRERIEGAFHEVQNTGRHLEHLPCKTVRGLITHVAAKMTSHALKLLFRHQVGIDIRTGRVVP